MQIIRNYVFVCKALKIELNSKQKLLRHYFLQNKLLTGAELNKMMGGDFSGTFTHEGDQWTFSTVTATKKQPEPKSGPKRKPYSVRDITAQPYTKRVGDFMVTYSGHTHKPIMTSMYSPSKNKV